MRDIRLEEMPFTFNGKTYLLRCNMNVLADVQDAFGGQILGALNGENVVQSVLIFTAAMLNDYADEQGWPERYTARYVGRKLAKNMLPTTEIMGLVTRSIVPDPDALPSAGGPVSEPDTESPGGEPEPGN